MLAYLWARECTCLAKNILVALYWGCTLLVSLPSYNQFASTKQLLVKIKFLDCIIWMTYKNKGSSGVLHCVLLDSQWPWYFRISLYCRYFCFIPCGGRCSQFNDWKDDHIDSLAINIKVYQQRASLILLQLLHVFSERIIRILGFSGFLLGLRKMSFSTRHLQDNLLVFPLNTEQLLEASFI